MKAFKLANLLFSDDFLAESPELLYRADGVVDFDAADRTFAVAGAVDFLTYFNAFPLAKWREYTGLDNLALHIEVAGADFDATILRAYPQGQGDGITARVEEDAVRHLGASDDFATYLLEIPIESESHPLDATLLGLRIEAPDAVVIRNAYFLTRVPDDAIRPVRIALVTTTFDNEQYIRPNIELVKNQVLGSSDEIAQHFHLFVVDNGRTLDVEALGCDAGGDGACGGVTVVPNPNVGGAGGFARGMMCALEVPPRADAPAPADAPAVAGVRPQDPFTHVLLMDDDVHVSPESFKRCFNLLSLARPEYADAFVNGAMLQLQHPDIQFEDVSFVRETGGYQRYKMRPLDVSRRDDCVRNEALPITGRNSYGAWWFSCIPVSAIRRHGLPLPLFIRIDDIEFAMRCQPTYMAMSGICVWHSAFNNRYRASVDAYQYQRNMMICIAVDGCSSERAFMMRFWRNFHMFTRVMNYEAAELWLDALQDYLRGPKWLASVDGAKLMREMAERNEKMVPIEELDPELVGKLDIRPEWLGGAAAFKNPVLKVLETLPHDRHWFPDFMLRKNPAAVDYSVNSSPWQEVAMRRTLVALDADAKHAHVRTMDRERYRALQKRYRGLRREYRARGAEVAQAYRDAMPELTSIAFWRKYLEQRAQD